MTEGQIHDLVVKVEKLEERCRLLYEIVDLKGIGITHYKNEAEKLKAENERLKEQVSDLAFLVQNKDDYIYELLNEYEGRVC